MATDYEYYDDSNLDEFENDNDYINEISDHLLKILPKDHSDILIVLKIKGLTRLITELKKKVDIILKNKKINFCESKEIHKIESIDLTKKNKSEDSSVLVDSNVIAKQSNNKFEFLRNLLKNKMVERYNLMVVLNEGVKNNSNIITKSLVPSSSGSI